MPYVNHCTFMGHAGRNAELKQSKDGKTQWAEFSLAIGIGNKENPETMWVSCRVFGKNAMTAVERVNKGDLVQAMGRLTKKEQYLNLAVSDWQWIRSANKTEADTVDLANATPTPKTDEFELPF